MGELVDLENQTGEQQPVFHSCNWVHCDFLIK